MSINDIIKFVLSISNLKSSNQFRRPPYLRQRFSAERFSSRNKSNLFRRKGLTEDAEEQEALNAEIKRQNIIWKDLLLKIKGFYDGK